MQQETARAPRTNLAPIPFESDAAFLKIEGELPRGVWVFFAFWVGRPVP